MVVSSPARATCNRRRDNTLGQEYRENGEGGGKRMMREDRSSNDKGEKEDGGVLAS